MNNQIYDAITKTSDVVTVAPLITSDPMLARETYEGH